jgi:N-acyl-L-homoserine lactone synthetase
LTARGNAGEDILLAGDAIARQWLTELEPLVFVEAVDAGECADAFRLRYRALAEMGVDAASTFPDGMERDEFDAGAVHILGREAESLVATSRLVLPAPGRQLPMLSAYDLALSDTSDLVEWGRLVVDPAYRGDGHSVLLGLAAQGWLSLRARGFSRAIAATPRRLVNLFDVLGFAVTVLGAPRLYWGEERCPILCDGPAAISALRRQIDSAG